MNNTELIEFLKNDLVLNCQIIEAIKNDRIDVFSAEEDCVAIYSHDSDIFMLSCDDLEKVKSVFEKTNKVRCALTFNKEVAQLICNRYDLKTLLPCYQAVWLDNKKMPISNRIIIDKLEPTEYNIKVVYENYSRATSLLSMRRHFEDYGVYGAFIDGELVGFVGTHSEHSIGMLEVLPNYQRMGVGSVLLSFISNLHMESGVVPFAHIVDGNLKSYNLFVKNKFAMLDKQVYWCY